MKIHKKAGLTAGVLAAVTMLIAPAAFATNTLSVSGSTTGGAKAVTGALPSGGTISFLTDFGTPASCNTATIAGTATAGASVTAGSQIGAISSLTFGSSSSLCDATGLHYPVIIEKSTKTGAPATWGIYVKTTPAKGATTVPIEIRNVTAKMHSTNTTGTWACDLQAAGTVPGTFNQVTQQISITPVSGIYPLAITAYDGTRTNTVGAGITCGGEIYNGDAAQMTGSFTLTPTVGTGGIHF